MSAARLRLLPVASNVLRMSSCSTASSVGPTRDDKLIFAAPDLVNFLGKILKRYPALLSRDYGPLDRVPKLPHVARPTVRLERGQRFGVEAVNILSVLLIEFLNEVDDEQVQVFKSLAQRRDRDPENVKAVVQILPQFPCLREPS